MNNVITLENERLTKMKKIFLMAFSTLMLIPMILVSLAFSATGQAILSEIQNRYEKTNDFEANFIQEYIGKVMRQANRGEGKVYFKKKGMMRWDYTSPNQKLISDGRTLWYYQPEEKQVLLSDISKVLQDKTPLAFLAGEGNLGRDFNILNLNESVSQKENNYIIELSPKEALATLAKLTLTVDKKTHIILQTDVFDGLGNVTRTRFIDIKTNVGLSNSFFHFSIPPGTEVIRMQESFAPGSGGKGPK
ncbi:MAG: outer membrane lipoprotein carrier protein LolA [Deltaproteobacteria bacterium RBG_19FT_COMBO_46_12]|nr:MAG: outer membrane lipoprotein carrier protein LolA [Deltaproteobacteria bacterium RBG_19FT_COMBO_46_12]